MSYYQSTLPTRSGDHAHASYPNVTSSVDEAGNPKSCYAIPEEVFLLKPRQRLNLVPILISLFLPWCLFSVVFSALATDFHRRQWVIAYMITTVGFMLCVICGAFAVKAKLVEDVLYKPSWLKCLCAMMSYAWILATVLGSLNYHTFITPHRLVQGLTTYAQVDPSGMRGGQLMDAGILSFVPGTWLDLHRAMSFRHRDFFCVAPITIGNKTLATYDFWAVGKNCCNDGASGFHCSGFNVREPAGVRLLDDASRDYYRMAVQQAEAAFKIKAVHPLFFTFGDAPDIQAQRLLAGSSRNVLLGIMGFFVFQGFAVAMVTLVFAKVA